MFQTAWIKHLLIYWWLPHPQPSASPNSSTDLAFRRGCFVSGSVSLETLLCNKLLIQSGGGPLTDLYEPQLDCVSGSGFWTRHHWTCWYIFIAGIRLNRRLIFRTSTNTSRAKLRSCLTSLDLVPTVCQSQSIYCISCIFDNFFPCTTFNNSFS